MNIKYYLSRVAKISGLILVGLSLGWLLFVDAPYRPQSLDDHIEQTHSDDEGNIIYTCSMHPSVQKNEPGDCPICGMELIPVTQDDTINKNPYEISMSEAATKLAEVQTTTVVKDIAVSTHRLPGKIMVDERRHKTLSSHVPGRIEELYVSFTGEYVSEGDRVASIYSPQLVSAQKELLEVSKNKTRNPSLYKATRNKLINWEITEEQINQIESSQSVMNDVDITSKVNGYVINKVIEIGSYVQQGSTMFKLADLSKVWVIFDAYESDVLNIKVGDEVSFSVKALPGVEFSAKITFIDPILNSQSRTVSVRAEADNENLYLKPNMLAQGIVKTDMSQLGEQILIPKSAVLWTGERSVVYVKKPTAKQPTFEFREVVLGQRVGDQYIVKSGLSEGEEVVTNGTFKIDSAAQLAGKTSMMNKTPDELPGTTGNEGHNLDGSNNDFDDQSVNSMGLSTLGESSTNIVAPEAFKNQIVQLVESYMDFKNGLVHSKPDLANEEVSNMQVNLEQVNMALLDGQSHMIWMRQQDSLQVTLTQLANTQDLTIQRVHLMELSRVIQNVINLFQIEGLYYQQFCSMANNAKGAYWLSEEEAINNPYFGEQMLNCGETIDQIEFQINS